MSIFFIKTNWKLSFVVFCFGNSDFLFEIWFESNSNQIIIILFLIRNWKPSNDSDFLFLWLCDSIQFWFKSHFKVNRVIIFKYWQTSRFYEPTFILFSIQEPFKVFKHFFKIRIISHPWIFSTFECNSITRKIHLRILPLNHFAPPSPTSVEMNFKSCYSPIWRAQFEKQV